MGSLAARRMEADERVDEPVIIDQAVRHQPLDHGIGDGRVEALVDEFSPEFPGRMVATREDVQRGRPGRTRIEGIDFPTDGQSVTPP